MPGLVLECSDRDAVARNRLEALVREAGEEGMIREAFGKPSDGWFVVWLGFVDGGARDRFVSRLGGSVHPHDRAPGDVAATKVDELPRKVLRKWPRLPLRRSAEDEAREIADEALAGAEIAALGREADRLIGAFGLRGRLVWDERPREGVWAYELAMETSSLRGWIGVGDLVDAAQRERDRIALRRRIRSRVLQAWSLRSP